MRTSTSRIRSLIVTAVLATATLSGSAVSVAPAGAQTNPFERGPAPTVASVEATRGPFSFTQTSVSNLSTPGFGAATVYYPTGTSQTFGGVAISPGFTASQSSIAWLGPRLASQGFVVVTIDTNSIFDFPSSRADQLQAALNWLASTSSPSAARARLDSTRLALMGHSMGGGGTMEASVERPSLQAAIPLTGWHSTKSFSSSRVPTLVVGAESDTVAPVGSHSIPFYNSLSSTLDKAYLELNNASHFAPNSPNTLIAKYSISWLKRFVDNDTRYEQFLCGAPHQADLAGGGISDYRDTCPYA